MLLADLDEYLSKTNLSITQVVVGGDTFTVITGVTDADGNPYEVAFVRNAGTPWVPAPAIHVRPHRVKMGDFASQTSVLGEDWQYLSRRFDRPQTPKSYIAHVVAVVVSP